MPERRDAFCILSLYLSYLFPSEGFENGIVRNLADGFDIRAEKLFWDEVRRGLVDKDALVRRQSLHILKISLGYNSSRFQSEGSQCKHVISCANGSDDKQSSTSHCMTKREKWAEKEAKSLGLGQMFNVSEPCLNSHQRWEVFVLLYEMLEEYGAHLVEAAWSHQVSLLLCFSGTLDTKMNHVDGVGYQHEMETVRVFNWLAVLWERGFCHDNPQVRCLIMQSFLSINWENNGNYAKFVPESFIVGAFIQGLNDPIHHKDFGLKGVYCSETIEGASKFLRMFSSYLSNLDRITFMCRLASVARQDSFGRAGLMALAVCIASVACDRGACYECGGQSGETNCPDMTHAESDDFLQNCRADLLDALRMVLERSKQHFNANYRIRACEQVLDAATSVMRTCDVPIDAFLLFISSVPREFTDYGGTLRHKLQQWFSRSRHRYCSSNPFLQNYGTKISSRSSDFDWVPIKFLLLISSLVQELQVVDEKSTYKNMDLGVGKGTGISAMLDQQSAIANCDVREKFCWIFLFILKDVVSYASSSCSIFWSCKEMNDTALPSSVKGKLGGPSQRRLASSTTAAVLQAISSVKTLAYISLWCSHMKIDTASLDPAFHFFWNFSYKVTSHPINDSETRAEVHLAAYEALVHVFKALFTAFCPLALGKIVRDKNLAIPDRGEAPILDSLVLNFLRNINDLLAVGTLTRSRLAVLMDWKWLCLVSLLSIPYYIVENGVHLESIHPVLSDTALKNVFGDLVDSLENASESSVLPILRSVRLVLGLFCSTRMHTLVSTCNSINSQMMLQLVHSSWILHVSCNKRRIAPIAALLSSVLHSSVFGDLKMHQTSETYQGPLKWFIERILDEGLKSPRTVRLTALHLTGLWLLYPKTIKYYIRELKLLSLHGSVAFDEDFEAELVENHEVRMEVSLLAKNPEPELAEVFINTEMYARVSVAVLFQKLANLAESSQIVEEDEHAQAALHSGKLFLLELLDSVVNEKDLSKELYKKYSGVHRRKVRAWQMICVLSPFVDKDVVQNVTSNLHICLYRNNLPAVRQYLEIFAIKIYLAFPALAEQQLIPIFHDYSMRPQALASYVFIASNIILHANEADIQLKHLEELLPPMVPFLTSHHHSLRAFTQLLLYHVLWKLMPALNPIDSEAVALERKCFMDLKSYLTENSDCARLRASMGGILDSFDPNSSATPHAIFIAKKEEPDFECVPTSLMEQVINFLNDAREDLRCSMTKDVITIKNENLVGETCGSNLSGKINEQRLSAPISRDASLDFQKKVTLQKHDDDEIQKEDELLNSVIQSRISAMQRIRDSRQTLILVASLLDRIPNLAGLARTCEVFKAAALTVADASILHDKQFQLISVTAEKWVPIIEVPTSSMKFFLEKKKHEGFSILGLEQTANSVPLDKFSFPSKTVLVLGREKEGIPVDIIHFLDACIEIPQLGVVRSLNVHVSGAIALWEYTRQQRAKQR